MTKIAQKKKKPAWPSLQELETIIFRNMKTERPEITREMARRAAAKIRQSR